MPYYAVEAGTDEYPTVRENRDTELVHWYCRGDVKIELAEKLGREATDEEVESVISDLTDCEHTEFGQLIGFIVDQYEDDPYSDDPNFLRPHK